MSHHDNPGHRKKVQTKNNRVCKYHLILCAALSLFLQPSMSHEPHFFQGSAFQKRMLVGPTLIISRSTLESVSGTFFSIHCYL